MPRTEPLSKIWYTKDLPALRNQIAEQRTRVLVELCFLADSQNKELAIEEIERMQAASKTKANKLRQLTYRLNHIEYLIDSYKKNGGDPVQRDQLKLPLDKEGDVA